MLDVITHVWNNGGDASLEVPPLADTPIPEPPEDYETNPEARLAYNREKANIIKANKELHSMRCDVQYKVLIGRHVCVEGVAASRSRLSAELERSLHLHFSVSLMGRMQVALFIHDLALPFLEGIVHLPFSPFTTDLVSPTFSRPHKTL